MIWRSWVQTPIQAGLNLGACRISVLSRTEVCVVSWYLVLIRTFGVMYDHTVTWLTNQQGRYIWPQVKWAVNLVIADGHFNLSQGFVWVCMG